MTPNQMQMWYKQNMLRQAMLRSAYAYIVGPGGLNGNSNPPTPSKDTVLMYKIAEDGKWYEYILAASDVTVSDNDVTFTAAGLKTQDFFSNVTEIKIPSKWKNDAGEMLDVTSIGVEAFKECTNLISVTIPNSVTSIGEYAFDGCSILTSVTIPSSVTRIEDSAFYDCSGLASVTIGSGVTSIGSSAFCNCHGLTSISIPNNVTSIGYRAFYNCSSLTNITLNNKSIDDAKTMAVFSWGLGITSDDSGQ